MKSLPFRLVKDRLLESPAGRPFTLDLYTPSEPASCPLIIFAHGFKGFKDWGQWHLIAEAFAMKGFAFLKFNFSHNGVTPENPQEFADLEAFGNNNFSKELQDLEALMSALHDAPDWLPASVDLSRIALIGHSRGGALAILFAAAKKGSRPSSPGPPCRMWVFSGKGFPGWSSGSKPGSSSSQMPGPTRRCPCTTSFSRIISSTERATKRNRNCPMCIAPCSSCTALPTPACLPPTLSS
ncbi:MAG: dienelactone hydrolase family protein [Saprospirales bacterium]|nr:dienelactone hydrolase family protein [Saprospirales bacterium]